MDAPTSRRLDMALPADCICAKTMKAMTTVISASASGMAPFRKKSAAAPMMSTEKRFRLRLCAML